MASSDTIIRNGMEISVTFGYEELPEIIKAPTPKTVVKPDPEGIFKPVREGHFSLAQAMVCRTLIRDGFSRQEARAMATHPDFFDHLADEGITNMQSLRDALTQSN